MKTRSTTAMRLGMLAAGLLLVAQPAPVMAENATINGAVEAVDYDEDGNAVEVAIYDGEWGEVLVLHGGKGAQLLAHVGEFVSATGEIRELDEDSGYAYGIMVASFTVDETAPDEDAEDPGFSVDF